MICKKCGKEVASGKFCIYCGAKLEAVQQEEVTSVKRCPNCGAEAIGKFCTKCGTKIEQENIGMAEQPYENSRQNTTNIFNNIGGGIAKQFGNLATNITAIKSHFDNNQLIYKVEKLPNVKEKKITVNNDEVVYIDLRGNIEMHCETFTIIEDSFLCFYVNKVPNLDNTLSININTCVSKLNDKDTISLSIVYNYSLKVTNIDNFFNSMINIKNGTWTNNDFNEYLFNCVGEKCSNKIAELLAQKGGLDLRDIESQVKQLNGEIKNIISNEVSKLATELVAFDIASVNIDIDAVNDILIANLFK